jgi:hypothetical protein
MFSMYASSFLCILRMKFTALNVKLAWICLTTVEHKRVEFAAQKAEARR